MSALHVSVAIEPISQQALHCLSVAVLLTDPSDRMDAVHDATTFSDKTH
jgi:hypothetical protein